MQNMQNQTLPWSNNYMQNDAISIILTWNVHVFNTFHESMMRLLKIFKQALWSAFNKINNYYITPVIT